MHTYTLFCSSTPALVVSHFALFAVHMHSLAMVLSCSHKIVIVCFSLCPLEEVEKQWMMVLFLGMAWELEV